MYLLKIFREAFTATTASSSFVRNKFMAGISGTNERDVTKFHLFIEFLIIVLTTTRRRCPIRIAHEFSQLNNQYPAESNRSSTIEYV